MTVPKKLLFFLIFLAINPTNLFADTSRPPYPDTRIDILKELKKEFDAARVPKNCYCDIRIPERADVDLFVDNCKGDPTMNNMCLVNAYCFAIVYPTGVDPDGISYTRIEGNCKELRAERPIDIDNEKNPLPQPVEEPEPFPIPIDPIKPLQSDLLQELPQN